MNGEQGTSGGVGEPLLSSECLTPEVRILEVLKGKGRRSKALAKPDTLPGGPRSHQEGLCRLHEAQTIPIRCTHLLSRISGNAASDKNIKDGVCAQIEKNFARAKWKVGFGSHSPGPSSKYLLLHPAVPCCYCTSSAEHQVFSGPHRPL